MTPLPSLITKEAQYMDMSSLCILDAVFDRINNQISEEVYLQCLLDHAIGTYHGANGRRNGDTAEERYSDLSL
jgi:hypothetical protein